jgi:hypothetical protein
VSRPHQIRVSCADLFGTGSAPNILLITGLNELVARLCAAARGLHGTCEALAPSPRSSSGRAARAKTAEAIELAERHGWGEKPLAGVAYTQLSIVMVNQGRLDEAEP